MRVLGQVKVTCDVGERSRLQTYNVSVGGHRAMLPVLLFNEGIPAHAHCTQAVRCVRVRAGSFTYARRTRCSTETRGKLCCSTASELPKQLSADKPCILSPRERARA